MIITLSWANLGYGKLELNTIGNQISSGCRKVIVKFVLLLGPVASRAGPRFLARRGQNNEYVRWPGR